MPRHIALLRGINVGGHRVKMDHLRTLFAEMGFDDVETFIASGNVIFTDPGSDAAELGRRVEARLEQALGYEVATFVRSPEELRDAARRAGEAAAAMGSAWGPDASTYVTFTHGEIDEAVRSALEALESDTDRFVFQGREIFWLLAGKLSASPLFKGNDVAKAMAGTPHTARNLTSLRKLLAQLGVETDG